jgi:hypothetical protein
MFSANPITINGSASSPIFLPLPTSTFNFIYVHHPLINSIYNNIIING